jgi:phenylalanyl-tRNA synthetase beta chain
MKISEFWLRESVDLSGISRTLLLDKLTAAGLEVEGCEPVAPAFSGVVVAEIITCEKHPDADKLRVCQVAIGTSELLQIVCGAPNARVGLKAPLATVGAQLPDLSIKVGKLRGVESFGMLCSSTELGLPAGADGLYELPADAPVGHDIRAYLGLDDAVIELKMTPNRSDCLGVHGLTRELCALFNRPPLPRVQHVIAPSTAELVAVQVLDPQACPRYLSQTVTGINPDATTPLWLQERLRRCGLRSIHPVVDITNYVLLEFGQPMHAFDLVAIDGAISVRRARAGEQLTLLDAQNVTLDEQFLVIADASKALAVAGVMGGFDSRVTELSTQIVFEAAHFAPSVIMGRARKLGLHTDASHRFERGVDASLPEAALARAVQLLIDCCGGHAGPIFRAESVEHLPKTAAVLLRRSKLDALLGLVIQTPDVEAILRDLGFAVENQGSDWRVTPHSARFDIAIEQDLIEEIARVYGYDLIEVKLPTLQLQPLASKEAQRPLGDLRRILAARDYQEALTFAFSSSAALSEFGLTGHPIKNPLSSDIDVMRPTLLVNLLAAVAQNQRRQVERVRLFELGAVFIENGTREPGRIAGVAIGAAHAEQWGINGKLVDFYDVKADVEALLPVGVDANYAPFSSDAPAYLHPGRSACIALGAHAIGVLGELHPSLVKSLALRGAPIVFELDLDAVRTAHVPKAQALSKFPSSRRDLALVVAEDVSFAALRECAMAAGGAHIIAINCFDVYRGTGLPEGHKSLAISLILQDFSRTLSDVEVDSAMHRVIAAACADLGGVIRS